MWFQNRRSKERRMKSSNVNVRRNFFRTTRRNNMRTGTLGGRHGASLPVVPPMTGMPPGLGGQTGSLVGSLAGLDSPDGLEQVHSPDMSSAFPYFSGKSTSLLKSLQVSTRIFANSIRIHIFVFVLLLVISYKLTAHGQYSNKEDKCLNCATHTRQANKLASEAIGLCLSRYRSTSLHTSSPHRQLAERERERESWARITVSPCLYSIHRECMYAHFG